MDLGQFTPYFKNLCSLHVEGQMPSGTPNTKVECYFCSELLDYQRIRHHLRHCRKTSQKVKRDSLVDSTFTRLMWTRLLMAKTRKEIPVWLKTKENDDERDLLQAMETLAYFPRPTR